MGGFAHGWNVGFGLDEAHCWVLGQHISVVPLFAWHGDDANVLFVLLLCCGLLFENYIVDASIFWNLR